MTSEEHTAHLQAILEHDDNDLSPNDKAALRYFIKREPLVLKLLSLLGFRSKGDERVHEAAEAVRNFKATP